MLLLKAIGHSVQIHAITSIRLRICFGEYEAQGPVIMLMNKEARSDLPTFTAVRRV